MYKVSRKVARAVLSHTVNTKRQHVNQHHNLAHHDHAPKKIAQTDTITCR
jgi:hypothetical protein